MNEAQPQLYEPMMRRTPQGNIAIVIDAKFMLAIDEAPFYVRFEDNKKTPRAGLVCLNGLSTDGNTDVLKVDHNTPIPGLYAAGNICGARYSNGYMGTSAATPSAWP